MNLTVCCWKWNRARSDLDLNWFTGPYTVEHVNTLQNMVRRHLQIPHNFLCFTDDPTGLNCQTAPIPAPELLQFGGAWNRLWLFSQEAKKYGDWFLSIDLDTVITADLQPLLAEEKPLRIVKNHYAINCGPYAATMWLNKAGSLPLVWHDFTTDDLILVEDQYKHKEAWARGWRFGDEQSWLGVCVPEDCVHLWDTPEGVLSYRLHASENGLLPKGARVVYFNGEEDPASPVCQAECPWITQHWN